MADSTATPPSARREHRPALLRGAAWLVALGAAAGVAVMILAPIRPPSRLSSDVAPPPDGQPARRGGVAASPLGRTAMAAWRRVDPANAGGPTAAIALDALRAWAKADPSAAVHWARGVPAECRTAAMVAALEGAAADAAAVVVLGREAMRLDPARAADFGAAVVGALVRNGAFGLALDFARSGPEAERGEWLKAIFAAWAEQDPAFAREITSSFAADGVGGEALTSAIDRWAVAAPEQAAWYALSLPEGAERRTACDASFTRWAAQDPQSLAAALPAIANAADRDVAAAAFVCATDSANRPTADALRWAEVISSAPLRAKALTHVLQEWAQQDAGAALRYIETTPRLTPEERAALDEAVRPHPLPEAT